MVTYDLEALKRKLVAKVSFREIQKYFDEHFLDKEGFLALGHALNQTRVEGLACAIGEVMHHAYDADAVRVDSQLVEVPEFKLIHGSVKVNGKFGMLFFLDELSMGLFTLVEDESSGLMRYFRFCARIPGAVAARPN